MRTYEGQSRSIARTREVVGERRTMFVVRGVTRELAPAVIALMDRGDRRRAGENGSPHAARHLGCGGHVTARPGCDDRDPPVPESSTTTVPAGRPDA